MSKYEPLKAFLAVNPSVEIPMQFAEIEKIIGASLPPVAFKHRAWWSNNPSNSVITNAWLDAGYKTERVDMGSRRLVFRRANASPPARRGGGLGVIASLRSALGGTVQVAPGVDLTDPAGEWEAEL
jgi:hypothetical protein